jgi:WD40 repeat protein
MPRTERPLTRDGTMLTEFAEALRQLRRAAGTPTYRDLAKRAHYSSTTLADAASGQKLPTLAVTLAYVRACGGDPDEWESRWSGLAAELSAAPSAAPACTDPGEAGERCPYVGLTAFGTQDAELFFGRERLTDDLVARTGSGRFVAVFGASGCGKSSLLRAGLLPRLRAGDLSGSQRWPVVVMTPGPHPLQECAARVAALSGASSAVLHRELCADPRALHLAVLQAVADGPADEDVLLVVDQFEELFTLCADGRERTGFIAALLDAAAARNSRIRVVLGVRADFYSACSDHPDLVEALRDAQLLVGAMSTDELRRAISMPAVRAGCSVESALLAQLVADATGQAGVLPLVSHALRETWYRRRGNTLTLTGYEAAGGIRHALARTAETVYRGLTPEQRKLARQVFLRLVALGDGTEDTKRRVSRGDLAPGADAGAHAGADAGAQVRAVLDALARARLITLDTETVQLTHEALLQAWPRLRGWLTEDRAGLRLAHHLTGAAISWQRERRDPALLFRGSRLAAVREWASHNGAGLVPVERDFLAASAAAEAQEYSAARRRARLLAGLVAGLVAGLGVLLVVALAGTVVALDQRHTALTQRDVATSRRLAARAQAELDTDVGASMRDSIDAMDAADTVEARGALFAVASHPSHHGHFPFTDDCVGIALSADARLVALVCPPSTVEVWDLHSRLRIAAFPAPLSYVRTPELSATADSLVGRGAFDAEDRRLAVRWLDGGLSVFDLSRSDWLPFIAGIADRGSPAVAFSPDGTVVAFDTRISGEPGAAIGTWSSTDERVSQVRVAPAGRVTAVAIGPDRTVAAVTDTGQITLWNPDTRAIRTLATGQGPLTTVAMSADGRLATGDGNGVISVWAIGAGARASSVKAHSGPVKALAFGGDRLVSTGADQRVVRWVLPPAGEKQLAEERLTRLGTGKPTLVEMIAVPSTDTIVGVGDEGVLYWLDDRLPFVGQTGLVYGVAFAPTGGQVSSVAEKDSDRESLPGYGSGQTLLTWDAARHHLVRTISLPQAQGISSFSANGRFLATMDRTSVTVLDTVGDRGRVVIIDAPGGGTLFGRVAVSDDGKLLTVIREPGTIGVWNVAERRRVAVMTSPSLSVPVVTVRPDGGEVVAAYTDGTLGVWTAASGEATLAGGGPSAPAAVALRRDGRMAAVGRVDGTVELWDLDRWQWRTALHTGSKLTAVAFAPGGGRLATAGADGQIVLWDVRTGSRWATLTNPPNPVATTMRDADEPRPPGGGGVTSIAWSPDGATIVAGGYDHTVTPWTIDIGQAVRLLCQRLADFQNGRQPPRRCLGPTG